MSAVPHRKITQWKPRESYRIETVLSFNISLIKIKVSLRTLLKLDISEALYGHIEVRCASQTQLPDGHSIRIMGVGVENRVRCASQKFNIPDGNHVNHIE